MKRLLSTVSVLAVCAACGSSRGSEKSDAAQASSPEGRWKSACFTQGEGQAAQNVQLDFNITKDRWALDYVVFTEGSCKEPFLTNHIEGPYKIGAASGSVAGAYEGEFMFDKKTVTPHMDAAVTILEQACGENTYAVKTATDVLEKGCAGFGSRPSAQCAADYDLVKIEGDTLRFGKRPADNDMCVPEKRPTELGPSGFKKVL